MPGVTGLPGLAGLAGVPGLHGPARPGLAWPGLAWPGLAWPGLLLLDSGLARPGLQLLLLPGLAWLGLVWPGLAWPAAALRCCEPHILGLAECPVYFIYVWTASCFICIDVLPMLFYSILWINLKISRCLSHVSLACKCTCSLLYCVLYHVIPSVITCDSWLRYGATCTHAAPDLLRACV